MKYRKLRIAWSLVWGVACLLLIVLWVRSYSRWDNLVGPFSGNRWIAARSFRGRLFVGVGPVWVLSWEWTSYLDPQYTDLGVVGTSPARFPIHMYFSWKTDVMGFGTTDDRTAQHVVVPYWFVGLLTSAIAFLPWSHFRFGLRTLLIAITVAAIGLGWIAYEFRK